MFSTSLDREIHLLLAAGKLSHRQIALRLGVGRSTVNAIARGRRSLRGMDPVKRRALHVPTMPSSRCPQCGYRVYLPCLICDARSQRESKRRERILLAIAVEKGLSGDRKNL